MADSAGIGNRGQLCAVRPVARPAIKCAATKKAEELVVDFRPFEEACQRFPLEALISQPVAAAAAACCKHSLFVSLASDCQSQDVCSPSHLQAQQLLSYVIAACHKSTRSALQVKPALATVEKAQPSDSFARVDYTPTLESAINEQVRTCSLGLWHVSTCLCSCIDCVLCVTQINIEYNIRCSKPHCFTKWLIAALLAFVPCSAIPCPVSLRRTLMFADMDQQLWHLMLR